MSYFTEQLYLDKQAGQRSCGMSLINRHADPMIHSRLGQKPLIRQNKKPGMWNGLSGLGMNLTSAFLLPLLHTPRILAVIHPAVVLLEHPVS